MDKIAIITDSVACLPQELTEQYHIHIVPAGTILFEGKAYRDWLDISPDEAYHMLESSPEHFSTSATSPTDFLEAYKEASRQADTVIYIALSSKFSTLYNMARVAKELAKEELPETEIEVFDSRTAAAAQGFMALAAARATSEGKSLAEMIAATKKVGDKINLLYIFETVRYLYRTGRLPKAIANLGSKLNVKPIITVHNGSAQVHGVARNKKRGVDHLLEFAKEKITGQPVHMAVLHAGALDEAESLKQLISAEFNCVELWLSQFSPIMAYATGRGVIGIAFYPED